MALAAPTKAPFSRVASLQKVYEAILNTAQHLSETGADVFIHSDVSEFRKFKQEVGWENSEALSTRINGINGTMAMALTKAVETQVSGAFMSVTANELLSEAKRLYNEALPKQLSEKVQLLVQARNIAFAAQRIAESQMKIRRVPAKLEIPSAIQSDIYFAVAKKSARSDARLKAAIRALNALDELIRVEVPKFVAKAEKVAAKKAIAKAEEQAEIDRNIAKAQAQRKHEDAIRRQRITHRKVKKTKEQIKKEQAARRARQLERGKGSADSKGKSSGSAAKGKGKGKGK